MQQWTTRRPENEGWYFWRGSLEESEPWKWVAYYVVNVGNGPELRNANYTEANWPDRGLWIGIEIPTEVYPEIDIDAIRKTLKPCPHCGCKDIDLVSDKERDDDPDLLCRPMCCECGATISSDVDGGRLHEGRLSGVDTTMLVSEWNRRPNKKRR